MIKMKFEKKFIIVIIIVMILNMIFNIKYCYAEIPIEDWMSSEMKEEIRKRNEQERKERYERNKKYQEEAAKEAGRVFNSDIVNYEPTKEDIPEEINTKVGKVLGVIQIIGTTVAVLVLMIIGIRAMTGSVEEKAEYKKSLPGYVIGAILVAAIGWLPTLIYNMVKGI